MAGTAATYLDGSGNPRNRSVTTAATLDIARMIPVDETDTPSLGAAADSAASSDSGTFSLIALFKRLLGKFPSSLGTKTAANSFSVTLSSDDDVLIGSLTEAAPGTDTASSGLNGRLQRIAQRLTAVLAALTSATSLSDASRVPVDERDGLLLSGTASSAATLFTQDMLGYESATVHVVNAGTSCVVSYETSDDNSVWVPAAGMSVAFVGANASSITSSSNQGLRFGNLLRYFRARVSTYGSGTVSVVGYARKAPAITQLPSVTITQGSTVAVVGPAAHDAVISGAPNRIAGRAQTANYTPVASGDTADLVTTLVGAVVQKPFSIPELDWSYAAASGGEVGTGDVAVKAPAAAGLRNYMTWLTAENVHASVDTEFVIKDGSTVIYRGFLKALGVGPVRVSFPSPLRSTAATALNIANITTGAQVYFNCGGYVAP